MKDLGPTLLSAQFRSKGWGFERWLDNNQSYCGKLLYFVKDRKCSIHYHLEKEETFYLHRGRLEIRYCDDVEGLKRQIAKCGERVVHDYMEKVVMEPGDIFKVPPGRAHQMLALQDSELFEFSTFHKEEDSYRIMKGD
jgi:mannose-6-phosphate isomerase-like protein (cupin superfamily)